MELLVVYFASVMTCLLINLYTSILVESNSNSSNDFKEVSNESTDEYFSDLKEDDDNYFDIIEERNREFEKRISRMKEELAMEHEELYKEGTTVADLGDPNIYNIPHDEVDHYQVSMFDEVSE